MKLSDIIKGLGTTRDDKGREALWSLLKLQHPTVYDSMRKHQRMTDDAASRMQGKITTGDKS